MSNQLTPTPETTPANPVMRLRIMETQKNETGTIWANGMNKKKALFENVNRWSRAGKNGKYIHCPHCFQSTLVWHFAWSALKCAGCNGYVDKHRWIISNVSQNNNIAVAGKIAESLASGKK